MTILNQTLPGSYGGVFFFVTSMNTVGGIKSAKHVFPNSENQVIENLGKKQLTYSMRIFITNKRNDTTARTTSVPGDNAYKQNRDALINVLDAGERKDLVHPLFGRVSNIIAVDWTLDEDFADLGIAKFSVTFEVSLLQSVPKEETGTETNVNSAGEGAQDSMNADIAGGFSVDIANNIKSAIEKVDDIVDAFKENTALFSQTADQVNDFNAQVGELSASVADIVRAPAELADSIQNIYATVSGLYATTAAAFGVMTEFFNFGDDDVAIQTTTSSLIERKTNNALLNNAMQGFAISHAYTLAAELEFDTIEDQEEIAAELEAQYDKVTDGETITNLTGTEDEVGLSVDTKNLITEQRIALEELFNNNRITLGRTITVKTQPTTARLLAYQYYGESTQGEEIAILNNISDSSFMPRDVDIITA